LTDLLAVGIVRSIHGIRGEVAVRSYSGGIAHLARLKETLARKGAVEKRLEIEAARPATGKVLMKIRGIDTPEKARELLGFELWVERENASPLLEGEYYEADLCRCRVFFGSEVIGEVRSVVDAGSAQLLEVVGADGKRHLIPFVGHFIGEVDVKSGKISLMEDYIVR
jgi:16S rRNA processing protein RimM